MFLGVSYWTFFSSRRRHTRFDCDWSSDVCSSDLVYRGRIRDVAAQVGAALGRAVREAARQPDDMRPRGIQSVGHRAADAARGAGDEGELPAEGTIAHPACTSLRNSSRVLASWSRAPRSALVTVHEFCFSTPRIIMQRW